jgi:hypothetical protein
VTSTARSSTARSSIARSSIALASHWNPRLPLAQTAGSRRRFGPGTCSSTKDEETPSPHGCHQDNTDATRTTRMPPGQHGCHQDEAVATRTKQMIVTLLARRTHPSCERSGRQTEPRPLIFASRSASPGGTPRGAPPGFLSDGYPTGSFFRSSLVSSCRKSSSSWKLR